MLVNIVIFSLKRLILYMNGFLLWYIFIKFILEECRNILVCVLYCCYYFYNYGDILGNLFVVRF